MNVSGLENLLRKKSVSKEDFMQGFKYVQNGKAYSGGSLFASSYTDSELESIYSKFDTNGDGQIDKLDNIDESTFSDKSMSQDDLNLLVEGITNMLKMQESMSGQTLSSGLDSASSSSVGSGSSKARGGNDSGNVTENSSNSSDYSSMSEGQLKAELETAKNDLDENQNTLNSITDGSHSALKALKDDIDEKQKLYQEKLNTVAPKLAAEYEQAKTDLDNHNQQIDNQKVIISQKEAKVSELTSEIESLDGQISSYDKAIANLRAQTGSDDVPEDLSSKISELEAEQATLKAQIEAKNTELAKANEELNEAKTALTNLEALTSEKEQALQTIQDKIDKLNNEELNTLKANIETAQTTYDEKKSTLKTEAETKVNAAKEKVKTIQTELNKVQTNAIELKGATYNAKQLYDSLELEKHGLDFDKFNFMVEGYNKLEDKGDGRVSIVDEVSHNCYVIDLAKKEFVGMYRVSTGHKETDIDKANQAASYRATPGGWIDITGTHYGRRYDGNAVQLEGLEDCNSNTASRGVIGHHIDYGIGNNTWGCLGFKESVSTIKNEILREGGKVFVIKDGMINANSKYRKQSKYYTT